MTVVLAAIAGVVFALGLAIAGMTAPSRVIGFLDVTGSWDGTLAFVIGSAIAVYAVAFRLVKDRDANLPTNQAIDAKLVGGSALFGIGWGLSGYCPGPALVSIGGAVDVGLFVIAMIAGMAIARRLTSTYR